MGSRVIGFRVPDDLAEELERVSCERGMTTAEFLRKLIDDTIYPSNPEKNAALADTSLEEQINTLEDTQSSITDEFGNLSKQIDRLTQKIGQLEANNVRNSSQITTKNNMANLANTIKDLEQKQDRLALILNENTNDTRGALFIAQKFKDSADDTFDKIRSEINTIKTKLEALNSLSIEILTVRTDFLSLSDRLSKVERQVKRIPTGEIDTFRPSDGREHTYSIYKSPAGLTKPHRLSFSLTSSKYIDLSEPLN